MGRLRMVALASVLLAWFLPVRVLAQWVEKVNWVTDHMVALPHIVAGSSAGAYAETTVLLTNPSNSDLTVQLGASLSLASLEQTVTLGPLQSRELVITADAYTAGWIIAAAPSPFGADAHVITKSSRDSQEVLSRVALPALVPVSQLVFPVRLGSAAAENTAFALSVHRFLTSEFQVKFTLYDLQGNLVTQTQRAPQSYTAMYTTELFPGLPEKFSGFMAIDLVGPIDQPMAFSAVAVYTAGNTVFSAQTTGIDKPGVYLGRLSGPGDADLESLSQQYRFEETIHSSGSPFFTAKMTRQVARVVARDPRIESLRLNELIPLAGSPSFAR